MKVESNLAIKFYHLSFLWNIPQKIKEAITRSQTIMTKLQMTERELKEYLRELKKKVFQSA
ncbi:hypothetical protein ES708_32148 [subsurface metagenome]